jgi:hypothetical protein
MTEPLRRVSPAICAALLLLGPSAGTAVQQATTPATQQATQVTMPATLPATQQAAQQAVQHRADSAVVRAALTALAHDSMEGRRTGTRGARRAARFIAAEMSALGLVAAGDSGYYQRIPLARVTTARGERLSVLPGWAAFDALPGDRRVADANIVGLIPGSDPALRDEVIIVGAHYDHIGIVAPVNGDSIANGADDDASGVIAILEIARALLAGPAPRRTVVFIAFAGEEIGGLGAQHYLANPTVPVERMAAQFQVEMIGRPDPLVGGHGMAWLTGFERSTMGTILAGAGIPIVQDPRPEQNFFRRSDNYRFARAGVPAHTFSSFNLHSDYHRVTDEVDRIDVGHMTALIDAAAGAVRVLADGPRSEWKPGMRPEE